MRPSLLYLLPLPLALGAPLPRALPTPVDGATARLLLEDREWRLPQVFEPPLTLELSAVVVAVDSNVPAYARSLFKTWDISAYHSQFLLYALRHS